MAFVPLIVPLEANMLQRTHCHLKASVLLSSNYHWKNTENE